MAKKRKIRPAAGRQEAPPVPGPGSRPRLAAAALLLIALAAVAYIPAMTAGFVWDDDLLITENRMIRSSRGLYDFWFTSRPIDYFPLTSTTFWLEWRLWGLNASGYHMVNVILHALSAVVIWRLLRRLRVPGAYIAAAVFAVHPLGVASVAWIAERKNTLSMLFYTLSVLAFLRFESSGRRGSYALALLLFLLALLSKTSVVMMPLILLVLAWWERGRITRTDVRRVIPFFLISLLLGLVTVYFQYHAAIGETVVRPGGFLSRLAGAAWAVWFYLYKVLIPVRLSMIYPLWNIAPRQPLAWLPLLGLAAAIGLAWRYRMSWGRSLLAAAAHFVLMLLPVLGFVDMAFFRLSLVSDHLQYAAMIAPIAAAVGAATAVSRQSRQGRRILVVAACVLLAILSTLTWRRAGVFAGQRSLWEDTLRANPKAWLAHIHLGLAMVEDGEPEPAIEHFRQAIWLKPDHVGARVNLGDALGRLGRTDEARTILEEALGLDPGHPRAHMNLARILEMADERDEAIDHYRQAIAADPELAEAHVNFGNALLAEGRPDEAVSHYRKAVELKPELPAVHFNLGIALSAQGRLDEAEAAYRRGLVLEPDNAQGWCDLGILLGRKGLVGEATECFRRALAVDPQHASAHYNIGMSLQAQGRADEAAGHYRQTLRQLPDSPEALYGLGTALAATGDHAGALENLGLVVKLRPDDPVALNTMAWLLATAPDADLRRPGEAVRLAEHAADLTKRETPEILDTLAAAYAAGGDYRRAIVEAQAAVDLAEAGGADELAREIGGRLELYRQSKPYVAP